MNDAVWTGPTALRFGIDTQGAREPKDGERYYRIELADGREALILAQDINVADGGALLASTGSEPTVVLAPGTWCSAYMCEALPASDPSSILQLQSPEPEL